MMHCVWFSKGNALPDVDVGTPRSSFDRLSNQLVSHGDAVVSEPIGTMPIQPLLDAEGAAFDPDDIKHCSNWVASARARVRALWGLSGWRGNEGIGKL